MNIKRANRVTTKNKDENAEKSALGEENKLDIGVHGVGGESKTVKTVHRGRGRPKGSKNIHPRKKKVKLDDVARETDADSDKVEQPQTVVASARGRPRIIPMSVPNVDEGIATDPIVEGIQLQAWRKKLEPIQQEMEDKVQRAENAKKAMEKSKRDFQRIKQEKRAEEMAIAEGEKAVQQMIFATERNHLIFKRKFQEVQAKAEEAQKKGKVMEKLRIQFARFRSDHDHSERGDSLQNLVEKFKDNLTDDYDLKVWDEMKKHFTVKHRHAPTASEIERIKYLTGAGKSTREIEKETGIPHSTVHNILTRRVNVKPLRRGRHLKLGDKEVYAIARFLFLKPGSTLQDAKRFALEHLGKDISTQTIRSMIKGKCGFRFGDFRQFPAQRNLSSTLDARKTWAQAHRDPKLLHDAIFVDEMPLRRVNSPKTWTISGWTPSLDAQMTALEQISLIFAGSPSLGTVFYSIKTGAVSGEDFKNFLEQTVQLYVQDGKFETVGEKVTPRLLIMDRAKVHVSTVVSEYVNSEEFSKYLTADTLPPYSPFLNIAEEIFAHVKIRLWFENEVRGQSKAIHIDELKARLRDQVEKISKDDYFYAFQHMSSFLPACSKGEMIFSRDLYDKNHKMEDYQGYSQEMCPLMDEKIEDALRKYLPSHYFEFTPLANQEKINIFHDKDVTSTTPRLANKPNI